MRKERNSMDKRTRSSEYIPERRIQDSADRRNTGSEPQRKRKQPDPKMQRKRRRKRRRKHRFLKFLLLLVLIIAIAAGTLMAIARQAITAIHTTPLDKSKLVTVEQDANIKNYTNIALFGVDTRSQNLAKERTRSDAIIICSINNKTKEVKLTSLYRDLYCSVNGTYTKLTHAYAYGGPELAISTLNRNLDLNISQYATVNFKIMANIVNAIGGIDLVVEKDFINDLNKFVKEVNRLNGGNSSTFTSAGKYTFDGNQAVAYARIRHNQQGDVSRANRQRIVLQAIMKKAQTHPIKFAKAMKEVLPQVQTNIDSDQLTSMAFTALKYKVVNQSGFPEDRTSARINGLFYEVPTTLKENVIKLHKDLFGTENYTISDELNRINDKIMMQTGFRQ